MRRDVTDVSVIVPVYNAPDEYVATCVEGLLRQECRRFSYEIILVDDGSRDEPLAQQLWRLGLADRRAVTCVTTTHGGPAVARSIGIEAARGNLIALTDIDCVPRADWLARYVEAFDRSDRSHRGTAAGQPRRCRGRAAERHAAHGQPHVAEEHRAAAARQHGKAVSALFVFSAACAL